VRRRITLTMMAMVVGALVLAGLGTLGLTLLNSTSQTQSELLSEAKQLAQGVQDEISAGKARDSLAVLRTALGVLKSPLQLQGEAVLAVSPDGSLYNLLDPNEPVTLPSGLSAQQVESPALIEYGSVSGHRGRLAWAAYLFSTGVPVGHAGHGGNRTDVLNLVVVLTREAPTGIARAETWFFVASAVTVVVALLAALRLARRIARPLQDTEAVTRRIAAGDLNARVPVPEGEGRELVSLASSVNQMAASLARSQGAQRQFLMSVSHDLRTPLTSIRGFAEALADGATTDVEHAVGIIGSEARRLERLVGDLLELARLESGVFSLRPAALDASEVVADAAHALAPQANELGLVLDIKPAPPGTAICQADPDRLKQVVGNLAENALKYASTRVVVATACPMGRPVLVVEDDGPGIPAADLPHVFERLFQSSSTRGRKLGGGAGLGLSIVAELVSAMGGEVRAESPAGPGGGTRMVVTLKVANIAGPGPADRPRPERLVTSEPTPGGPPGTNGLDNMA
jgi:signal transduction histidine kinase